MSITAAKRSRLSLSKAYYRAQTNAVRRRRAVTDSQVQVHAVRRDSSVVLGEFAAHLGGAIGWR